MHNTVMKGQISKYSYYVYTICIFINPLFYILKTITLGYCCCSNTRVTPFSSTADTDVSLIRRKKQCRQETGRQRNRDFLPLLLQCHLGQQSTTLPVPIRYCSHCSQNPLRHPHEFDVAQRSIAPVVCARCCVFLLCRVCLCHTSILHFQPQMQRG